MSIVAPAKSRTPSAPLQRAINSFNPQAARGFLGAASIGLPTRDTVAALEADLQLRWNGRRDPVDYDPIYESTRASYAALVGVPVDRVATGSQTSVLVSVVAAAAPDGAEVLCVDGDFSSVVFPFLQRSGIRVRSVPLDSLADSVTDETWLVAFSFAQSATGQIADVAAITEAAHRHGALTLCDTTQAAGVHPVHAGMFDVTVCHAYKWLCCPRGVAFLTVSEEFQDQLTPIQAGWYAGDSVWSSCYAPEMHLATTARRFDVSPVWQAWVGAEPAVRMFAGLDIDEVWAYASGLGDMLCDALGVPEQHQAIITWADAEGTDLATLTAAGITVTGRAGRMRASFHLWNNESDVLAVARALKKVAAQ
jgi:selenocysteine lyase/cysteine desulfurase